MVNAMKILDVFKNIRFVMPCVIVAIAITTLGTWYVRRAPEKFEIRGYSFENVHRVGH